MSTRTMNWRPRRAALAMIAAALLSSACVVVPERYVGETVAVAPPAARVEEVGVAPGVGYVWIGGYWGWVGGRHEWVPGYWEHPHPGFVWEPHRWVQVNGGWRLRQGYWRRR